MSLGTALNSAVSGLNAQSTALAAVSENIANANTTAYKTREISFQSLIIGSNQKNAVGGGVEYTTSQAMDAQGLLKNTSVATNVAISGDGFFVVSDDPNNQPSAYQYTRNGDFDTDENGLLVNTEGMLLLGQRTNENGVVTATNSNDLNSLEPIDLNTISGSAGATKNVSLDINLPADSALYTGAPADPTYTTALEVFDDLGISHTIEQTWYKTGVNTWQVDYADPYRTDLGSGSPATGTISPASQTIVFNGDGSIDTIDGNPAQPFTATITGLTTSTGANDLSFNMDLGTQGLFDGLTQFSSSTDTPDIEISNIDQDGVRFGQLSRIEVDNSGLVTALFDNGVRRPIYQIPVATFPNPDGLTSVKGTVYDENQNAGNVNLRLPGEGNAGTVSSSSLEQSTVDTSEEFNKMIVAQQSYSAAAQVVSKVDQMFQTLIGAVQ